jgi:hypothetical protein
MIILDIENGQYVETDELSDEAEAEIRAKNNAIWGPSE